MEMEFPAPRRSTFSKLYREKGDIDYDMASPLGSNFPFPCRGFPPGPSTASFKAGETVPVSIVGGAPHGGGDCQFALSYNNGKDFVVIQDEFGSCPLEGRYNVRIPQESPSGKAVFAWAWVNAIGNREYYMNCADIDIQGNQGGRLTGKEMLVVNLPGSPVIPEFAGNRNTGAELFAARKTITISGDQVVGEEEKKKGSDSATAISPGELYTHIPVRDRENEFAERPKQESGVNSQDIAAVSPQANNNQDKCHDNEVACNEGAKRNEIRICRYGEWISMECPSTTVCYSQGSAVFCGYRKLRLI
ncbi:uncharacterized protein VTP21DRAFT_8740 [Calcarisporiella thermophila]|uniref:uncharacterized protein n=1 Tax=Calcarisporiella thermophila TaxID=911321 RepID=UPI003743D77B